MSSDDLELNVVVPAEDDGSDDNEQGDIDEGAPNLWAVGGTTLQGNGYTFHSVSHFLG